MKLFLADWIHLDRAFVPDAAVLVDDDGRIVATGPRAAVRARPDALAAEVVDLEGKALLPGTISAHSHSFQVLLRGTSDHPASFRDWVKQHLYPLVERLDHESLEAGALLCFAQMARAGVTSVGEFHYLQNAPDDYAPDADRLAEIVIGAARRVGIRIAFLRAIYDVQERFGQARMVEPPAQSAEHIRALAARYRDDPFVHVMPAPHSLHGATREAIELGAGLARELGTRWHIHLAEQRGDVGYAERFHQATPLRVLDRWGLVDERLVVVHGIWLDAGEQKLLAERKAALVSNPSTNQILGDGIAPLSELVALGVPVALGTDLNQSPSVFQEMRQAEMLQRVHHLRMGMIPTAGGGAPDPQRLFDMGTRHGATVLDLAAGVLEPGRFFDAVALDLSDPSLLPGSLLGGTAILSAVTCCVVGKSAVRDTFVGGRPVIRDGKLVNLTWLEVVERLKKAKALPRLEGVPGAT